jgi:hypothetical protein
MKNIWLKIPWRKMHLPLHLLIPYYMVHMHSKRGVVGQCLPILVKYTNELYSPPKWTKNPTSAWNNPTIQPTFSSLSAEPRQAPSQPNLTKTTQPFQIPRKDRPNIPFRHKGTTNTMKIGANSSTGQHWHHVGSTRVKGKTSTAHKNMVEAT